MLFRRSIYLIWLEYMPVQLNNRGINVITNLGLLFIDIRVSYSFRDEGQQSISPTLGFLYVYGLACLITKILFSLLLFTNARLKYEIKSYIVLRVIMFLIKVAQVKTCQSNKNPVIRANNDGRRKMLYQTKWKNLGIEHKSVYGYLRTLANYWYWLRLLVCYIRQVYSQYN